MKELGLEDCKGGAAPGTKEKEEEIEADEELSAQEAKQYRRITARVNSLAQDRAERLFSSK